MGERRSPGVEDGGEADARAQMLRVGGDRSQRLGGNPEQQVVDGRTAALGGHVERCVDCAHQRVKLARRPRSGALLGNAMAPIEAGNVKTT